MHTLSVIRTRYLGAVHAACMTQMGHAMVAVDTDAAKIAALTTVRAPLFEPGLDDLLATTLATGRLTFTTDVSLVADCDVHFICVGTPQRHGEYAAGTRYVFAAVEAVAPYVSESALVVGKPTVPVGTAYALTQVLRERSPVRR